MTNAPRVARKDFDLRSLGRANQCPRGAMKKAAIRLTITWHLRGSGVGFGGDQSARARVKQIFARTARARNKGRPYAGGLVGSFKPVFS